MSLEALNPTSYIYGALPDKAKEAITKTVKDGFEFIKNHPEMLGTGNPKIYGDGFKEVEKAVENVAHKAGEFFKDILKFTKEHPEMLLASAKPKLSIFAD